MDFPGVDCDACAEALDTDGVIPDCQAERGCLIPPLLPACRRVMELRGLLVRLHPTVDPGTVCRMFGATLDDLELLALVEDYLRENKPDGEGR